MDQQQRGAIIRLLIICAAWALGEALEAQLGVRSPLPLVPALLGAAAFFATRETRLGGEEPTYWRGRRIDRDRWRR